MIFSLRSLSISPFANRFARASMLVLVMSFVLVACGDLAGDPAIVAELPDQMPTSADTQQAEGVPDVPQSELPLELPPSMPDVANGAAIYAQNCTSCHGENGNGRGTLVENGQVPRIPSFLEASYMREQNLTDYYDIITNGNLANLMPPWQSLTVQERWDVLMYTYTLHYTEEQVTQGAELVSDSVDTNLALESDADLASALSLEDDAAFAAVAYQRVQSVQNWADDIAIADTLPEATPEPQASLSLETASFSGTIINGSPNASVPSGLTVQLQYGDFVSTAETLDATPTEDNQFSFADIPVQAGNTYFAVAFYEGRAFVSDTIQAEALTETNTVDVTIYETTTAPNVVNMTSMEIIIDFVDVPEMGRGIIARQLNVYENTTDYVFHLAPEGQDVQVSLLASFPVGSIFLDEFEQSPFIPAPEQYALIDTRPVYPGTHTISTSYFLPYNDNAQTVDIVLNNAFSGTVDVLVTVPELSIADETLTFIEEVNIGTEEAPVMARRFSGDINLLAGDNLLFDIEGRVTTGQASDTGGVVTQGDLIPILVVVGVVVVLVMLGALFYVRRDTSRSESDDA